MQKILEKIKNKYNNEPEFIQAVDEVVTSIQDTYENKQHYKNANILERLVVPDRIIQFRVSWQDDNGKTQVNTGYRVQFNNALGPYKGGLRFHPTVNLSVLKFLGFEQIFKNSLTGLSLGGGKGGSDFDPKGKSDSEVMRFCQAFMCELHKYIGPNIDVPAGDIGVGAREIGYLFGQYKRLSNDFSGVLTGKSLNWGGSLIRPEATGFGAVYFLDEMLKTNDHKLKGKNVAISGSGNVAQFAAQKAIELGAKVISMSDSSDTVYIEKGLTNHLLDEIKELKNIKRGRISEFAQKNGFDYLEGKKPWQNIEFDIAIPCATQNEIDENDAKKMVKNGVIAVVEGANMPTTANAVHILQENKVLFAPGKAANAGGVAVSGLEMAQNSQRLTWPAQKVDKRLKEIMENIHRTAKIYGEKDNSDYIDYVKGANIAGFIKVADAMVEQGTY